MQLLRCTAQPKALGTACLSSHSSSNSSTLVTQRAPRPAPSVSCNKVLRSSVIVPGCVLSSSSRAAVLCRLASTSSSSSSSGNRVGGSNDGSSDNSSSIIVKTAGSPGSSLLSIDDLSDAIKDSVRDTLGDISTSCKRLDESLDKDYIDAVVSLRKHLLMHEWQQHGKALAERKGVIKFERHCAENDIDIPFEAISQLYDNPYDVSVLESNKHKLMARSIIMEAVDEQYSSTYAECTQLAKELAKTSFTEIIPESAEKVAGTLKSLIPMPTFLKQLF